MHLCFICKHLRGCIIACKKAWGFKPRCFAFDSIRILENLSMKIALMINRLMEAPKPEEHELNLIRRARLIRIISETVRSLGHEVEHIEDDAYLRENLLTFSPELVFLQTFRADPCASILRIQALLDELCLPYTGSPPAACYNAQNKYQAKLRFRERNLPTPAFALVEHGQTFIQTAVNLSYPLFIKPLYGGCSMGIHPDNPVNNESDLAKVLRETQAITNQPVLIEEFIGGREFSVGILGNEPPFALPPIEFIALTKGEQTAAFRLFEAKTDAEIKEPFECPPNLSETEQQTIQNLAISAFQALGCRDYARVDIRCDRSGNPYLLEVNVHPSLLPQSSMPIMAERAGISYPQLFEHIFRAAFERYGNPTC